jgi:hypothetical protein
LKKGVPPIACKTIQGQDMGDFFKTGEAQLSFDAPLWQCTLGEEGGVSIGWEVTLQIMRLTDNKIVNMGTRGSCEYVEPSRVDTNESECKVEWHASSESHWPRMSASYGLALMNHFFRRRNEISYEMKLNYRTMDGNDAIEVFGFDLCAMFSTSGTEEYYEPSKVSEWGDVREGRVTYAHFLEALDGWSV